MIEGSGSGPLDKGSGSRRPKNIPLLQRRKVRRPQKINERVHHIQKTLNLIFFLFSGGSTSYKSAQTLFVKDECKDDRLNTELNLRSLSGLLCTAVLIGWDPATSPAFGLIPYTRALLVSQDRRHLYSNSLVRDKQKERTHRGWGTCGPDLWG